MMITRQSDRPFEKPTVSEGVSRDSAPLLAVENALSSLCPGQGAGQALFPQLVNGFPSGLVACHQAVGATGRRVTWEHYQQVMIGEQTGCQMVWELFKQSPESIARVRLFRV